METANQITVNNWINVKYSTIIVIITIPWIWLIISYNNLGVWKKKEAEKFFPKPIDLVDSLLMNYLYEIFYLVFMSQKDKYKKESGKLKKKNMLNHIIFILCGYKGNRITLFLFYELGPSFSIDRYRPNILLVY